MKKALFLAVAAAFALTLTSAPAAAGDAAKGQNVAKKCLACHDMTNAKKNKVGPYLWDIVGKPAGKVEGYKYSSAHMAKAGEITWDEATLDTYLEDPRKYIPGNKMAFAGVKDATERADLIEYMKSLK